MKTYLFDTFNRYKQFSEKLDVKTILCNKSWWIFNDNGEKEIYIFQKDGTLIISLQGKVRYSTWTYIPANHSIIITSDEESYMVVPAFGDDLIMALQVDGTNEYAFLVNEQKLKDFVFKSYNDILTYFESKEKCIEQETRAQTDKEDVIAIILIIIVPIAFLILMLMHYNAHA